MPAPLPLSTDIVLRWFAEHPHPNTEIREKISHQVRPDHLVLLTADRALTTYGANVRHLHQSL